MNDEPIDLTTLGGLEEDPPDVELVEQPPVPDEDDGAKAKAVPDGR
jgi:hypothetical protein